MPSEAKAKPVAAPSGFRRLEWPPDLQTVRRLLGFHHWLVQRRWEGTIHVSSKLGPAFKFKVLTGVVKGYYHWHIGQQGLDWQPISVCSEPHGFAQTDLGRNTTLAGSVATLSTDSAKEYINL
jgi:hypothetical protein